MNKIMEYMALRVPIVQYDLTGRAAAQDASLLPPERHRPRKKILTLLDDEPFAPYAGSGERCTP
jgi:hypothetical protein